jgi:acyl-CoA synthetase (NDP forming)
MKAIDQSKILKLLKKFKISAASAMLVKSRKELLKTAKQIKYPLAAKIDSPDMIHKTESNAIRLNIKDDTELEKAYDDLLKIAKKKKAKVSGILLQSMEQGHEVIVGFKKDPQFGHVAMFGMGGIFVEVMKDVSFRIVPINKKQALGMIQEIKTFPVLEGARKGIKANIDAIANIITNASKLVEKNKQIAEIDFNPIIVNEKTARVVDTRMITDEKK